VKADDLVCYCYRVSLRKLVNYARRERPARASQLSRCLDAGTGCGWCIPILKRIHDDPEAFDATSIDSAAYEKQRSEYRGDAERKHSF